MRASFQPGIFKIKIRNRCVPVLITVLWKNLYGSITLKQTAILRGNKGRVKIDPVFIRTIIVDSLVKNL
jgi:hypothetical protein